MPVYSKVQEHFASGNMLFLTFKGTEKASHQKIDFVKKLCDKISDKFFIVRESNKKTPGFHFHALIRTDVVPPAKWYIKGCHMHVSKVGKPEKPVVKAPPITFTQCELGEALECGVMTSSEVEQIKTSVWMERAAKSLRHETNVSKILSYMSKEAELPAQYTDYILVVNKKHRPL